MTTYAFTGTRSGMNDIQMELVVNLLKGKCPDVVLHGDATGADADFHDLVRKHLPNTKIIIYPGMSSVTGRSDDRANKEGDETVEPHSYFVRNRLMVERSDFLVATPYSKEVQQGGTWYTINYAKKFQRNGIIIYRDGWELI